MNFYTKATYENGVLKLDQIPPLEEKEQVRVIIRRGPSRAELSYGLIKWTGDPEVVDRVAMDPEFGIEECP